MTVAIGGFRGLRALIHATAEQNFQPERDRSFLSEAIVYSFA